MGSDIDKRTQQSINQVERFIGALTHLFLCGLSDNTELFHLTVKRVTVDFK